MKERRLKRGVIYSFYAILIICFCISLFLIENGFKVKNNKTNYVDKVILDKNLPVVKKEKTILKPYNKEDIRIISNFYDYKSDEENQEKSLIYYDNTYIQNSGILYGSDNAFDVLAVYDGEVTKIDESDILGKIVEIKHSNDVYSIYQVMSSVDIEINAKVSAGQKIGTSGISKINNNNKQQLYFELAVRGQYVNGEQYYGKKLEEV